MELVGTSCMLQRLIKREHPHSW